MERPSSQLQRAPVSVECGDCLKLKLPWKTNPPPIKRGNNENRSRYLKHRGTASICDSTASFCTQRPGRVAGFNYDAFSYAQNFDDGVLEGDDGEYYSYGFSSRYAAPASKSSSSSSRVN